MVIHDGLRGHGTEPLDESAAEKPDYPVYPGRRRNVHLFRGKLSAVHAARFEISFHAQILPLADGGHRAYDGENAVLALEIQHRIAGLFAAENYVSYLSLEFHCIMYSRPSPPYVPKELSSPENFAQKGASLKEKARLILAFLL